MKPKSSTPKFPTHVQLAIAAAQDKKAEDLVVLDLRTLSNFFEYFLIMTGNSKEHVRALTEHIQEKLEESGIHVDHVEGEDVGRWVLMDYGDLIIHIFEPQARVYYNLEGLWGDAPSWRDEGPDRTTTDRTNA